MKLHSFGTSAERSEERVMPKGCNFIAPQALIQQLYYKYFILLLKNFQKAFDFSEKCNTNQYIFCVIFSNLYFFLQITFSEHCAMYKYDCPISQ